MKIVFIGSKDIHKLGGIENYTYCLSHELLKSGHIPIVYCFSDRQYIDYSEGFKIVNIKSVKAGFLTGSINSLIATLKCLKEQNIDLIHYNFPPFNFLYSWIPEILGIKYIFEYHSFVWDSPKYSTWKKKLFYYITRFTTHHKICLTVSAEKAHFLENRHLTKKSYIIHPGISISNHSLLEQSDLKKYNLSPLKYFMYLGRLDRIKNIDILIRSFSLANTQDYKLVICGTNDEDPKYVAYLRHIASDKVIFTGSVYGDEKRLLINNCKVFCLLSDSEGLPIVILEAMYAQKVCLVSDINGNKEALGKSGVLVPVRNIDMTKEKIEDLIEQYESYSWQEKFNYDRVTKHFFWSNISKEYIKIIESYINK